MAMSFEWPWQYRFPPFFTLQPNVDTRQKSWPPGARWSLSFCRLHKQSSMTVMEAQESPLLQQRKLPVESIQVVLEELRKKGGTIVGWRLWPQKINGERKGKKKKTKKKTLGPLPH
uniref:Vacuolar protein-sorting-associated protein 25 n=1 Tax=Lynx canadensis TaxID=61383 RepID=A0A667H4C5_LYNCA